MSGTLVFWLVLAGVNLFNVLRCAKALGKMHDDRDLYRGLWYGLIVLSLVSIGMFVWCMSNVAGAA